MGPTEIYSSLNSAPAAPFKKYTNWKKKNSYQNWTYWYQVEANSNQFESANLFSTLLPMELWSRDFKL
jgi:hypothetical protein